ncbi:MAG: branched-chain amino acid ABC transporter permease [Rhizobiales bacterium]|nr:branched-chain amino acid ABC transporter permease [Hyphomicrobiales bacterium]
MFQQTHLKTVTLLLLAAAGVLHAYTTGYFGLELLAEIAILALLAVSLDLVAGYAGTISLCHGALYGVGAYVFAMTTTAAGWSAPAAMAGGVLLSALAAGFIGAVTARTHGIFFIMATLAFGQMAYVYVFKNRDFGGDDGLSGVPRLDLSVIGVDLGDPRQFALFCILIAAIGYLAAAQVLRSGLGRAMVGMRANEARMRALGLTLWSTKAAAFAISGGLAGLAGVLAAQYSQYVSPGLLFWTVSGEVLVVVILGGLGTLVGPILGAAVLVLLKHEVSSLTNHWHIVVGIVLIVAVLSGGRGIFGEIERFVGRRSGAGRAIGGAANAAGGPGGPGDAEAVGEAATRPGGESGHA